jgi:hypothetical protein
LEATAQAPWLFKVEREANRARLIGANVDRRETTLNVAIAKRDAAFGALQRHAEELRKNNPKLTIEMARVEARQRWPELAGRERAAAMEARYA